MMIRRLRPLATLLLALCAVGFGRAQPVEIKVLPQRIDLLDIQKKVAASGNPLLEQTRIDRFGFTFPVGKAGPAAMIPILHFEGVCLDPRYSVENKTNRPAEWASIERQLQEELQKIYVELAVIDAGYQALAKSATCSVAKIVGVERAETLPLKLLQDRTTDLDGVLFFGVRYNDQRQLTLEVLLAQESQRAAVDKLIKDVTDANPLWVRGPRDAAALLVPPIAEVWNPQLELQTKLATSGNELFEHTVVRRVWYQYAITSHDDLVSVGSMVLQADPLGFAIGADLFLTKRKRTLDLRCHIDAKCIRVPFGAKDAEAIHDLLRAFAHEKWRELTPARKFRVQLPYVRDGKLKPEVESTGIAGVRSPIYDLQKKINADDRLRGALAERAVYDRYGVLHLQGFVNEEPGHRLGVKKLLEDMAAEKPTPLWLRSPTCPPDKCVSVEAQEMRRYPEPLTPKAFQERLSGSRSLLSRQTRVDNLFFDYRFLEGVPFLMFQVEGVSLHPDWPAGEPGGQANQAGLFFMFDNPLIRAALAVHLPGSGSGKERTARTLFGLPLMDTWLRAAHPTTRPIVDIDNILAIEDPVPRLQYASGAQRNLDGMLFLPAFYDANAKLHFPVLIVKPEQEGDRASAQRLVNNAEVRLDPRAFQKQQRANSQVDVDLGGRHLRKFLQEVLADGTRQLRRVRLDRVRFVYADMNIKQPQVRCKGIALAFRGDNPIKSGDRPAADLLAALGLKVETETVDEWGLIGRWHEGVRLKANLDDVGSLEQPGIYLQREIAKVQKLDGVRVYRADDRDSYAARFDSKGTLVVTGEWVGPHQHALLCQLLRDYYKTNPDEAWESQPPPKLLMMGYRTDIVLRMMRQYAADRLEDVRLRRLYFNSEGQCWLDGLLPIIPEEPANVFGVFFMQDGPLAFATFADVFVNNPRAASYRTQLQLRLRELMDGLEKTPALDSSCGLSGRGVLVASSRWLPVLVGQVPRREEILELDLKQIPGLTQHLRTRYQAVFPSDRAGVQPPPERWDGMWFTRGFYDIDDDYHPVGYLANEEQRKEVERYLQELAPVEWRRESLPRGWNTERLKVMPLQPMVERLRIVMPAYTEFDGLTLQRAFHDVRGNLILRVSVVGTLSRKAAAKFKELLDEHPEWKERAAVGVRVQVASTLSPDPRVVENSLLESIRRLKYGKIESARELATTAILHDPEDSTAWYVRALTFLLEKDIEQAERDLRRTVLLEREGPRFPGPRANLRLERLELLQNKNRLMLNEGRKKVLNDVESGVPALKLLRTP